LHIPIRRSEGYSASAVEPLVLGIVALYKRIATAGEVHMVFCDSALAADVDGTNFTAILQRHELEKVRIL